jgi:hypothetical protein
MRKIFFIFFAFLTVSHSFAQTTVKDLKEEHKERKEALQKEDEEGVIDYKKEFAIGVKLISNGYGFFVEEGRSKSVKRSWLFQFEFSERKDPKEMKQTFPDMPSTAFIFGKENFFYPVKLGVQQQLLLGNKSNKNGVCITANYGGGIDLGLLRPYYFKVADFSDSTYKYVTFDNIDTSQLIVAGPALGRGWNGLSIIPGLYAKGAIRFDYGHGNQLLSAIEIGISAEFFTKKVPIIATVPYKQFFVSAYATIMFGGRK